MDARGLVAFIITVHELALVLAVLIGILTALVAAIVLREVSAGKRMFAVTSLAVGAALITFAVTARLFHVPALDVDVVRVDG
jgi:hypothetical protein